MLYMKNAPFVPESEVSLNKSISFELNHKLEFLGKQPVAQTQKLENINPTKNNPHRKRYLKTTTVRKMLRKLLTETSITQETLASTLMISIDDVCRLLAGKAGHLIYKINLPLIKLFCATRFKNNKGNRPKPNML